METSTKILLDNVVEDMNLLKKKMFWEADSYAMASLAAFLFANAGKRADVERYVECKKYLKKNTNIFSEMRGISEAIVITKMCLSKNYEEYHEGVTTVYKKLRAIHKLTATPHMVLTAINIYEAGGIEKADDNIEKLEKIYKDMKSEHFWLTGDEDRPFLAAMVSRNVDIYSISAEISACYEASKKMSFSKEAMHTASQIMSLSNKPADEKANGLKETMNALKAHKLRGAKYELMPMAAALLLIEGSADSKAAIIKENYDYLKKQKGFKWYIGGTQRSMYSILAYAIEHFEGDSASLNSVISSTITNIIIEELLTMLIIMNAANTVRATSSSSSGSN